MLSWGTPAGGRKGGREAAGSAGRTSQGLAPRAGGASRPQLAAPGGIMLWRHPSLPWGQLSSSLHQRPMGHPIPHLMRSSCPLTPSIAPLLGLACNRPARALWLFASILKQPLVGSLAERALLCSCRGLCGCGGAGSGRGPGTGRGRKARSWTLPAWLWPASAAKRAPRLLATRTRSKTSPDPSAAAAPPSPGRAL